MAGRSVRSEISEWPAGARAQDFLSDQSEHALIARQGVGGRGGSREGDPRGPDGQGKGIGPYGTGTYVGKKARGGTPLIWNRPPFFVFSK